MADEEKAEAEATEEAPSAEVAEEAEVEEKEEQPVKEEPDDNAERSKLGRRVSGIEQQLEKVLELVTKGLATKAEESGLDFGDDLGFEDDEDEISFKKGDLRKEVLKVMNKVLPKTVPKYLDQKSQAEKEYERKALAAITKLGNDLSDEEFGQVATVLEKKFTRYTGNPELDAKTNFLEAQVALLKTNKGKKKNPLDKNKDKKNENLGGGGGETAPSKKTITLSPEMKALQKKYKLSDEAAMRAVKQIK